MALLDNARQAVLKDKTRPSWRKGTFIVTDEAFQDRTHYAIVCGAKEFLEDKDYDFFDVDALTALVRKSDLGVEWVLYIDNMDKIDKMTSV